MSTALDLITGGLRRINSYTAGESLSSADANDALSVVNDLLESLSTSEAYVYGSVENIFTFTPNQYQYTIGAGGDFNTPRPLRVTSGFTRITTGSMGLDYPIDVTMSEARYTEIRIKGLPAPWPIACWYNPTYPLGTLYFYQAPSEAGQLHLFTDTILSDLPTLNTVVSLPQGYSRFLKLLIAKELAPEYGKSWTKNLEDTLTESRNFVKALNQIPVPVANYDIEIVSHNRADAGWILTGGF